MNAWVNCGDDTWVRADLIEIIEPAPEKEGRWNGKPRAKLYAAGKTIICGGGITVDTMLGRLAAAVEQ